MTCNAHSARRCEENASSSGGFRKKSLEISFKTNQKTKKKEETRIALVVVVDDRWLRAPVSTTLWRLCKQPKQGGLMEKLTRTPCTATHQHTKSKNQKPKTKNQKPKTAQAVWTNGKAHENTVQLHTNTLLHRYVSPPRTNLKF